MRYSAPESAGQRQRETPIIRQLFERICWLQREKLLLNSIIGFSLNVLCLSLIFALIGSAVWPIIRKLLCIAHSSASTDALLIVLTAIIFVVIRDYRYDVFDWVYNTRSSSKWRKSAG